MQHLKWHRAGPAELPAFWRCIDRLLYNLISTNAAAGRHDTRRLAAISGLAVRCPHRVYIKPVDHDTFKVIILYRRENSRLARTFYLLQRELPGTDPAENEPGCGLDQLYLLLPPVTNEDFDLWLKK